MGFVYEAILVVGLCLAKDSQGDSSCIAISGNCQADNIFCLGGYKSGLCSGASNRRCCKPTISADSQCNTKYGVCQEDYQLCDGAYQSSLCSGPSNRRCCLPPASLTNSDALAFVSANGLTWSSSGNCHVKSDGTCTSFTDMRGTTLYGLVAFKQALPNSCPIVITGGTETGHSPGTYSHGNGYKIDIRLQDCVKTYVESTYTRIADRGDGSPQWTDSSGNKYALESNHWDILYY